MIKMEVPYDLIKNNFEHMKCFFKNLLFDNVMMVYELMILNGEFMGLKKKIYLSFGIFIEYQKR